MPESARIANSYLPKEAKQPLLADEVTTPPRQRVCRDLLVTDPKWARSRDAAMNSISGHL
jgi:hypothetical protein